MRNENCRFSKASEGSGKSKLNLKKLRPFGGMNTSLALVRGRIAEAFAGRALTGATADPERQGAARSRAAVETPAAVFLSSSRRESLSSMSAPFKKQAKESETQE